MPQRQSTPLPKNWPRDVTFLTTLHIPPPLTPASISVDDYDGGGGSDDQSRSSRLPLITPLPATPNPNVRITPITTPTHPAYTQRGLFATRALPPSTFILFYLGTLHPSSTTDPDSNYDLSLDRDLDLSIDATHRGNEARFINDYRGVRPDGPNAEFRDCLVQVRLGRPGSTQKTHYERRIGVFVLSPGKGAAPAPAPTAPGSGRSKSQSKSTGSISGSSSSSSSRSSKRARGIAKGEEIVVSYGKGFWKARKTDEDDHEGDEMEEVVVVVGEDGERVSDAG
ncbi:hypothetical protein PV08_09414 [Exophiala spinifera]|uniref:SET domain-containing protein n=1 Tax=Exophiala spinifera TaxID=91928 RepID=A0A0D2BLT5_9EURO|nr:uncharacterized protein PV08_09414 [Exophiala spinifera]KIW12139.1 hypothetical protein PV08_09414 [Exophiala spinifera]